MPDLNPRIIENVDLTLVGQMGNEQDAGILSERMAIMLHLEGKITNVQNPALCQVIWAKDRENTYDIFAGYEVSMVEDLPEEITVYRVKSEKIAAFKFTGDARSLPDFVKSIYQDWIPYSDYSHHDSDFTHLQFVSQMKETINLLPSEKRILNWEVWIPIK